MTDKEQLDDLIQTLRENVDFGDSGERIVREFVADRDELWSWLDVNGVTLHCNHCGGNDNWSATYDESAIGGARVTIGLGANPRQAIRNCRAALNTFPPQADTGDIFNGRSMTDEERAAHKVLLDTTFRTVPQPSLTDTEDTDDEPMVCAVCAGDHMPERCYECHYHKCSDYCHCTPTSPGRDTGDGIPKYVSDEVADARQRLGTPHTTQWDAPTVWLADERTRLLEALDTEQKERQRDRSHWDDMLSQAELAYEHRIANLELVLAQKEQELSESHARRLELQNSLARVGGQSDAFRSSLEKLIDSLPDQIRDAFTAGATGTGLYLESTAGAAVIDVAMGIFEKFIASNALEDTKR